MLHPIEGGNELIVLLKYPWDFASANLYRSLLVSAATLYICSSQSSKDCGSLALKIGMSFIKCCFSRNVDDPSYVLQSIHCLSVNMLNTMCQFLLISAQLDYRLIKIKWGWVWLLLTYISKEGHGCLQWYL